METKKTVFTNELFKRCDARKKEKDEKVPNQTECKRHVPFSSNLKNEPKYQLLS